MSTSPEAVAGQTAPKRPEDYFEKDLIMLVIHRLTPFLLAVLAALGIALPLWIPVVPLFFLAIAAAGVVALLWHLAGFRFREPERWFLVGIPAALVVSAYAVALFLESDASKLALATTVALLVFFFAEHLFAFLHLPAAYQLHALEHVSLVVNAVTMFFAATSLFGLRLFLSLPLWVLSAACFVVSLFLLAATFWVCKVGTNRLRPYALGGALMLTELFLAMSFLPTGFFTNAALLTIFFYLYLGISRAHVLSKLSRPVARRYASVSIFLTILILATARWV